MCPVPDLLTTPPAGPPVPEVPSTSSFLVRREDSSSFPRPVSEHEGGRCCALLAYVSRARSADNTTRWAACLKVPSPFSFLVRREDSSSFPRPVSEHAGGRCCSLLAFVFGARSADNTTRGAACSRSPFLHIVDGEPTNSRRWVRSGVRFSLAWVCCAPPAPLARGTSVGRSVGGLVVSKQECG